jgi:hypothetical protein
MATNPVTAALESAKKTLNDVSHSKVDTGGQHAWTPPSKAQPSKTDYSHAREARKTPGEFMGVHSDQGSELKDAMASREANKKALEPNEQ